MSAAAMDVELVLLTPVLELAVLVAQAGTRAVPRIEAPMLLKPYTGFTRKVPRPALKAARRVIDEDTVFRSRLATVVSDELVGPAGVLFVRRPDGWTDALAALAEAERQVVASAEDERDAKALRRALERAESDRATTTERLAAITLQADDLRSELVDARARQSELKAELAALRATMQREESSQRRLRHEAESAIAERDLANESAAELRLGLRDLEAELGRRSSLDDAVAAAVLAVQQVHAALLVVRGDVASANVSAGPVAAAPPKRIRGERPQRRLPVRLPGGVLDDTADAANFLLRQARVLVLIDGYNVAMATWSKGSPGELRRRLEALVGPIAERTGATVHIVYDGDGAEASSVGRGLLRVSFTDHTTEADDLLIALAAAEPDRNPLVVVSADTRVVEGTRRHGASVLVPSALLALARAR